MFSKLKKLLNSDKTKINPDLTPTTSVLKAWLPDPVVYKEPENLEELFAQYEAEKPFFGVFTMDSNNNITMRHGYFNGSVGSVITYQGTKPTMIKGKP